MQTTVQAATHYPRRTEVPPVAFQNHVVPKTTFRFSDEEPNRAVLEVTTTSDARIVESLVRSLHSLGVRIMAMQIRAMGRGSQCRMHLADINEREIAPEMRRAIQTAVVTSLGESLASPPVNVRAKALRGMLP